MAVTLPIDVYEVFEESFGREKARKVIDGLERVIAEATEYKWALTKEELIKELLEKLVTKELFEERLNTFAERFNTIDERLNTFDERLNTVRQELLGKIATVREELLGKMENLRIALEAKIEKEILRLDRKFTIMFVVLFFTIIFLNQNALTFLARIIGLIK